MGHMVVAERSYVFLGGLYRGLVGVWKCRQNKTQDCLMVDSSGCDRFGVGEISVLVGLLLERLNSYKNNRKKGGGSRWNVYMNLKWLHCLTPSRGLCSFKNFLSASLSIPEMPL